MYRFIESVKLQNAQLFRLPNHQKRVDRTFRIHFVDTAPFNLVETLKNQPLPTVGTFKIRIVYSEKIEQIEIQPYTPRMIKSLQLVTVKADSSFFKSEIRDLINEACLKKGSCDDIVMVNNGLLTDTSYANIALFDGESWYTPRKPYLYGTNRDELIDSGAIFERDIRATDIFNYQKLRIFNALIEFGDVELEINTDNILQA